MRKKASGNFVDVDSLVEALNRAKMFNKMKMDSQKPFSIKVEIEKYQRGSENFQKFIYKIRRTNEKDGIPTRAMGYVFRSNSSERTQEYFVESSKRRKNLR
jgi:hypothetical protein